LRSPARWWVILDVVLADEPTAALDREIGRNVVDLLKKAATGTKDTTVMVTHDNHSRLRRPRSDALGCSYQ